MPQESPPTTAAKPGDSDLVVRYPPFSARGAGKALGCGLCMGTADAVPGVSGGTIALILGIYELFIGALADVVRILRHPTDRPTWTRAIGALKFLVPLGVGVISAYYVATKLLVGKLDKPTPGTWQALDAQYAVSPPAGWLVNAATAPIVFAFFFGLVLASVREPWLEKKTSRPIDWSLLFIGAAVAATLGIMPPAGGSTSPFVAAGAGALAISVMLLPGVSGSLALLVLGMYQIVTGAVHAVVEDLKEQGLGAVDFAGEDLQLLIGFGIGICLGIALFVPLLKRLLAVAHDRTMSVLSGLMLGSLVALWPWKAHYMPKFIPYKGSMTPRAPSGDWWWPVIAAGAGCALIVIVSRMSDRLGDD